MSDEKAKRVGPSFEDFVEASRRPISRHHVAVGQHFRGVTVQTATGKIGECVFVLGPSAWSDAGLELYFERRAIAVEQARSHAAHGAPKLVLVDGVAFSTPRSDRRPGWEIGSEVAVDLLTSQITLLAHELSGRFPGDGNDRGR